MVKKIFFSLLIVVSLSACSFLQFLPQSLAGVDRVESTEPSLIFEDSDSSQVPEGDSESPADGLPEGIPPIPEANPLKLTITIDQSLAVEAEIGPEGGTIQLTTPEGAQFILEIPAGALLSPELIRMIPLSSIEGIPVEEDHALGVKLEPEGIVFLSPVVLNIQHAPSEGDIVSVGFGTMGGGEDFHLQTSQTIDGETQLYLSHFSNYGVIQARREEINRLQTLYSPSLAQNYAVDQSSTILGLVDDPAAQLDAYETIMKQWFYNSLLTRIQNAAVFDDRLEAAVGEYLAWQEMIYMIDVMLEFDGELSERLSSEIEKALDALATSFASAFTRAHTRCVQENNPEEAFRMQRYGLIASHLDLWSRDGLDEEESKRKLESCFKFEFVFRSKIEGGMDGKNKVSQVLARIPLNYEDGSIDTTGGIINNEGDLVFEINTLSNMPGECQLTGEKGSLGVTLFTNLNYSLDEPWSIKEIKAWLIFLERPEEILTCTVQGVVNSGPVLWWRPMFEKVNKPYFDGNFMKIVLEKVDREEVFAEKELNAKIPEVPNSEERTKYELLHKPEQ